MHMVKSSKSQFPMGRQMRGSADTKELTGKGVINYGWASWSNQLWCPLRQRSGSLSKGGKTDGDYMDRLRGLWEEGKDQGVELWERRGRGVKLVVYHVQRMSG